MLRFNFPRLRAVSARRCNATLNYYLNFALSPVSKVYCKRPFSLGALNSTSNVSRWRREGLLFPLLPHIVFSYGFIPSPRACKTSFLFLSSAFSCLCILPLCRLISAQCLVDASPQPTCFACLLRKCSRGSRLGSPNKRKLCFSYLATANPADLLLH